MIMPKIPDALYNWLKWIALIALPALATFLSLVLGSLNVDPSIINTICTIITATAGLIGTLIGVSTIAYNKDKKAGEANAESKPTES